LGWSPGSHRRPAPCRTPTSGSTAPTRARGSCFSLRRATTRTLPLRSRSHHERCTVFLESGRCNLTTSPSLPPYRSCSRLSMPLRRLGPRPQDYAGTPKPKPPSTAGAPSFARQRRALTHGHGHAPGLATVHACTVTATRPHDTTQWRHITRSFRVFIIYLKSLSNPCWRCPRRRENLLLSLSILLLIPFVIYTYSYLIYLYLCLCRAFAAGLSLMLLWISATPPVVVSCVVGALLCVVVLVLSMCCCLHSAMIVGPSYVSRA
jgi:hypothetical protein